MKRKKVMEDAKTKFDAQVQDKVHALEICNNATQELQKSKTWSFLSTILLKIKVTWMRTISLKLQPSSWQNEAFPALGDFVRERRLRIN